MVKSKLLLPFWHCHSLTCKTIQMTAKSFRFSWDFIENISNRITNEVMGISRVFVDGQYLFQALVTSLFFHTP